MDRILFMSAHSSFDLQREKWRQVRWAKHGEVEEPERFPSSRIVAALRQTRRDNDDNKKVREWLLMQ